MPPRIKDFARIVCNDNYQERKLRRPCGFAGTNLCPASPDAQVRLVPCSRVIVGGLLGGWSAVQPDGIPPGDLTSTDPPGDFTRTGFRVPLIVASPFARKGYVSHTPADYTAVLKFIETRWLLSPLTKRDAAQMNMTEFFNFSNPPWATPPSPPAANVDTSRCYDALP